MSRQLLSDRLAVAGMGLCTPLGLTARATLLEMAAGTVRFFETEVLDREGEPVRASVLTLLEASASRTERMSTLAANALLDCTGALRAPGLTSVPLVLALPEPGHGAAYETAPVVAALAEAAGPLRLEWTAEHLLTEGRAGFFVAVQRAAALLASGRAPYVLVGAVDSLCDRESLSILDKQGRCLSSGRRDGTLPGEGAGLFLLTTASQLARQRVAAQGWVHGLALAQEPRHLRQRQPSLARGLTEALQQLGPLAAAGPGRVERVLSCQTGESFFDREFAQAYLRSAEWMPEPLRLERLAEVLGDAGAAAGALQLGRALHVLTQVEQAPPTHWRVLVYGCSDGGRVGACLVEAGAEAVDSTAWARGPAQPGSRSLLEHPQAEDFLRELQEQHLSEVDFLLEQRWGRLRDPEHSWLRLRELEERALAHARGLQYGGGVAAALVEEALAGEDRGRVRAAVYVLACHGPGSPGVATALSALAQAKEELLPVIREALVLVPGAHVREGLEALLRSPRQEVSAAAAYLLGHHREGKAEPLMALLRSSAAEVRNAAALALARLGQSTAVPMLERLLMLLPPADTVELHLACLSLGSHQALESLRRACRGAAQVPSAFLRLLALAGRTHWSCTRSSPARCSTGWRRRAGGSWARWSRTSWTGWWRR